MGKIFKEIGILGANNRYMKLKALFDTGAYYNYIAEEFRDGSSIHDLGILEFKEKLPVIFPNGFDVDGRMIKLKLLKIDKKIIIKEPQFCLFDMRTECDIIIGAKLMQELNIVLNPAIKEISFN
jgi:hypothetical protein